MRYWREAVAGILLGLLIGTGIPATLCRLFHGTWFPWTFK